MFIPQVSLDYLKSKAMAKFETVSLDLNDQYRVQRLAYLAGKKEVLSRFNEKNCNLGELQTIEVEVKSIIKDVK